MNSTPRHLASLLTTIQEANHRAAITAKEQLSTAVSRNLECVTGNTISPGGLAHGRGGPAHSGSV